MARPKRARKEPERLIDEAPPAKKKKVAAAKEAPKTKPAKAKKPKPTKAKKPRQPRQPKRKARASSGSAAGGAAAAAAPSRAAASAAAAPSRAAASAAAAPRPAAPGAHDRTLRVEEGRMRRALSQRMYLVHRESLERFRVCGSRGIVYTIDLSDPTSPTCSCPDACSRGGYGGYRSWGWGGGLGGGQICKHTTFVCVRALGISAEVMRAGVSASTITAAAARTWDGDGSAALAAAGASALGVRERAGAGGSASVARAAARPAAAAPIQPRAPTATMRPPTADSECPICFEALRLETPPTWCRYSCGNVVHGGCQQVWLRHNSTCVYCRASWT